ncbi:MAG: response regulator, partial [Burkholderiales bacterium]|nr:response regulator [Burkholderiales bacterium]
GELGEAAWACEQLYNARLADSAAADAPLRHFTADALDEFARWVDAIGAGDASAFGATGLAQRADALHAPPPAPIAVEPVEPVPALPSLESLVPDLPQASDLDFSEATLPLPPGSVAEQLSQAIEADEPSTLDLMLPELAQPAMPPAEPLPEGLIDLDLASLDEPEAAPAFVVQPTPATVIELRAPAPEPEPEPEIEQVKVIGPLRIGIPLFNIYLNEADELSRRLVTELAEWTHELSRPVGETAVAMAHSLAGSSATVGYADLSALARALEHALMRSNARGGGRPAEAATYHQVGEEIRRLLHQFAAGFLRSPEPGLIEQLAEFEHLPVPTGEPVEPPDDAAPTTIPAELTDLGQPALMPFAALADAPLRPQPVKADALDTDEDIDVEDALDQELFPIFEEEGSELIPQLQSRLRDWARRPGDAGAASACMRTLHTLKGGARLAGAMHLGEMAHRLETAIEHLLGSGHTDAHDIDRLVSRADAMEARFEALRRGPVAPVPVAAPAPAPALVAKPAAAPMAAAPVVPMVPAAVGVAAIDWARFAAPVNVSAVGDAAVAGVSTAAVRVRAPLLDRLVNHAGEVSITRARIESDVGNLKASIGDLTDNLERLRHHLRDIELQAESQIETRMEAARAAGESFDPLEMDRFTRFQELTRMMAESVNDVATVQRVLQRTLQSTEDELAHQARLTRDMQEDLLRTRMVEFEGLSERLYRVVRQAAKETGKQVRLDIVGGSIEIDRGVLDRMTGAFEHLLRNCVAHGIEAAATRVAAGKEASGTITISVTQEGNEVGVDFRDDGAGLNLPRIREKALASGLLAADAQPSDGELANLIFQPGFSTADEVTGLAGRGVGMDVVRADVNAMGGRIETSSAAGQGTSFRLVLPLTTAVTQVVMLRCGELNVAVPSTLVEIVRRLPAAELVPTYERGTYRFDDRDLPFFWLGALLQGSGVGVASGRSVPVVVIRSAAQRVVLQVDEVLGNQEVVVKNLGPQLSRLPGLAGMTLLPSGAPALIYNPVALATLYGTTARAATLAALAHSQTSTELAAAEAAQRAVEPLVLVVDDSLTVRRVTQRLLQREGYRVEVAKDGLEGLERLAAERPAVLLSDIEMPRMDGFDLVRNLRADARLADLPVIMITSRIAQKHRDYAQELGVNHYLGKPYAEDELLALVARYARAAVAV